MPSIFQKDCPQCAKSIDVQATRCRCGYSFDSENGEDNEEQLYLDYLAARAIQAEAAMIAAREDAAADPQNTLKAAQALLAEQNFNAVQAEIEARTAKPGTSKDEPQIIELRPAEKTAVSIPTVKPTAPATVHPMRTTKVPAATAAAAAAQKPSTPAPTPQTNAVVKKNDAVSHPAPGGVRPDVVFQRLQAAKANAALVAQQSQVKQQQAPKMTAPATPKTQPVATAPAKPVIAATTAKQECPNCTAYVQADAKTCRCGYAFPTSSHEVPALALDASALALLNDALNPRR